MRRLLAPLIAVAVLSVAAGTGSAATGRSISIVKASPAFSGIVTVTVTISGWKLYPARVGKKPNMANGGHWHLFVDGKYNNFSAKATTGKTVALKKGTHKIFVALANNDHSPLKPPVTSRTITVKVGVPTTPPPESPAPQPEPPATPTTPEPPETPPYDPY